MSDTAAAATKQDLADDVESRIARIVAFGEERKLSPRDTAKLVIECLAKVGYTIIGGGGE